MAIAEENTAQVQPSLVLEGSVDQEKDYHSETATELPVATVNRITRVSSVLTVIVVGLALFSDGYNAQITGYMQPLFSELYQTPDQTGIALLLTAL